MNKVLYHYSCTLVKVIDADSLFVLIDLGFKTYIKRTLRLARINSPEVSTQEGKLAKEYVTNILNSDVSIAFTSTKLDSYGRSIAEVYLSNIKTPLLQPICLNDSLVTIGHAVYKAY